ncbi:MAG: AraC family transcriptional regulator [Alphaproteobacteria bacterium]|nr:AraC family transcriptional regulator [Alphaproteobacteria bacterium]MBU1561041.1 AraC family transcriptional regulator [Alphaproteobacteria bacterium]MBU2305015.1 AraC family transcriptional regulator [Alphaproteobacteria bacterium]MBU2370267.1 AraC family transcriptional regulator [Alphaproteobacteria bacterium]
MKPYLERLTPDEGASWASLNRRLDDGIPFQWHHHPEFELTLTLNSRGQRFIGDHIGRYEPGDLVLIGPYLPHTWHSLDRPDAGQPHVALVMWFLPDWAERLTANAELRAVAAMLARAAHGLQFSPETAEAVRPQVENLFTQPPVERFLRLVTILTRLAGDRAATPLSATAPELAPAATDRGRIDRVLNHIHAHFAEPITISELADIAALSPSGLHRTFQRHTRQTVSQYLIRLRIGRACALLSSGPMPIGTIAGEVGYDSLANFNRQFKALKGTTPRAYRAAFLG